MDNKYVAAAGPRREARFAVFDFVKICDEMGEFLVEATIRQLSSRGAHLRLRASKVLPRRLMVISPGGKSSRLAKVIWINGPSIGIEFGPETDSV